MQGGVGESRVERFRELEVGGVDQADVETLGLGRGHHRQAIVDPDHVRAALLDLERQRAVAATDVEDMLAGLRIEQLKRCLPQRGHEAAVAGIICRIPSRGRGDEDGQSVLTHSR